MRLAKAAALGLISFLLGAAVTRYYDMHRGAPQSLQIAKVPAETVKGPEALHIDYQHEPLWAYGFDKPPMPGEKAAPQNPPSRNLRTDEDPSEQTRLRHIAGSTAAYSLVDVRDGQNVIDWFPAEHPPMPSVVMHGPASLGARRV